MNDQDNFGARSLEYADDGLFAQGGGGAGEEESGQLWTRIKGLLRGRYHWAVILAVILGGAAATAGFFSEPPKYKVDAKFIFKPYLPAANPEDSQSIPMFQEYLDAQTHLLLGPEVEERARQTETWQSAVAATGHAGGWGKHLNVWRRGASYVFSVENAMEDPRLAAASVNALIEGYKQVYEQRESETDSGVLNRLISQRLTLEREISQLQERKIAVADPMSPVELQMRYQTRIGERDRLQSLLSQKKLELKLIGGGQTDLEDLSVSQIAARYPRVNDLLNQREQLQMRIQRNRSIGMGENHPQMKGDLKLLEGLDKQIKEECDKYRYGLADVDPGSADTGLQSIRTLEAQIEQIEGELQKLAEETASLTQLVARVASIDREIESKEAELKSTSDRIESMMQNRPISGRIEVIKQAEQPPKPTNLLKRVQLGVIGGMFGAGLGVGVVLLIGLMDRHLRHASDAQLGLPDLRMLGMLPTLPEQLDDPEQAEMAANAVHHIRTMLQLGHEGGTRVFSVASATAGSGKSSLTVALGLSFSASGSRTLLIDCDVVGGGLTRRLLGEQVAPKGLLDACSPNETLERCLVHTNNDLDLLPLGSAGPRDAGNMSPRAIRRLIAQAREAYDVVIIDTGPVLGSLEASLVAPEVDAVVMIISRGDEKTVVNRSVEHIRSLGAGIAGLVFNHALDTDMTHTSYGSFVSQSRAAPTTLRQTPRQPDQQTAARFGPLGSAVATFASVPAAAHNGEQHSGAA
ncbi:MAG: AAA family ATPase [Planctomycetes bacterium]|jgi:capsular exopolysaccharide synthesis family protein|nr:AAA family ATPase [Planctomycetota bacterium]